MARVAKTVAEVIAGEAGGKTRAARYDDMRHIASVIANRAAMLGVTPEQVVSRQSEFNAYGKRMPGGTAGLVGLAEDALREVATAGPVTGATFYATPAAKGNLPKDLKRETKTGSHVYFSDPQNRAVYTSVGLKKPSTADRATAGRPIAAYDAAALPTPTPRDVTLASAMPARPVTPTPAPTLTAMTAQASPMSPSQETSFASRIGGLFGATPAAAAERMPSARPTVGLTQTSLAAMAKNPATTRNERAMSASVSPKGVHAGPPSTHQKTSRLGLTGSPLPPDRIDAATPMSPARAANVTSRLDASQDPTANPAMGGLLASSSPAIGGMLTPASLTAMAAPASRISGNERAAGLYSGQQLLAADVATQRAKAAAAARIATASPVQAAVSPVQAAAPQRPAAMPATATAYASPSAPAAMGLRPNQGQTYASGLGLPDTPAQPAQPGFLGDGGFASRNKGALIGGLLGSTFAGPVGGLLGGLAGRGIQNARRGTPSPQAKAALDAGWDGVSAMTEAQDAVAGGVQRRAPVAASTMPTPGMAMLPSVPVQPAEPGAFAAGGSIARNRGAFAGGLLGSMLGGPIGGLLGGFAGRAAQNAALGTPTASARNAMNAGWDGVSPMTSAQAAAARAQLSRGGGTPSAAASAAMNAGWDGFSGMSAAQAAAARGAGGGGFSSGASGPDGGKKSGSSSSSSGKKR